MSAPQDAPCDWTGFLAEYPAFGRAFRQFAALWDAAEVLDELQPPHAGVAAEYMREVGCHVMREAGVPEEFLGAMIAGRPSVHA